MAIVQNLYTGDGSTDLFPFSFPYLDQDHVLVEVNGVGTTAFTFANANTIQFNVAPANGASIRIFRATDSDNPEAVFFAGSPIRASDLNQNNTQLLYITQETEFKAEQAVTTADNIASTANSALSAANAAVITANAADSTANNALGVANGIAATAQNAETIALGAEATANGIAATANSALSTANSASAAANNAVNTANNALSVANGISGTANTALSTANSALSVANAALPKAGGQLTGNVDNTSTGYFDLPAGTTGQRPGSPNSGMVRFNTDTNQFEGYSTAWGALGGGATGSSGNQVFYENDQTVTANYTITSGKNAVTAGPIEIGAGITVTVPANSSWVIV
jgi:hypothetical protein